MMWFGVGFLVGSLAPLAVVLCEMPEGAVPLIRTPLPLYER